MEIPMSSMPVTELGQLTLETLCLHQAIHQNPLNPRDDAKRLYDLGAQGFILHLIIDCEKSLKVDSGYGLSDRQRLEIIQRRCRLGDIGLLRLPAIVLGRSSIQSLVCELQRYESLKTDNSLWSLQELGNLSWIFASRGLGSLQYKFPTNVSCIRWLLHRLIQVYESHRTKYGVGDFTPTVSFDLFTPGLAELCGYSYLLRSVASEPPVALPDHGIIKLYGSSCYSRLLYALCRRQAIPCPETEEMVETMLQQHFTVEELLHESERLRPLAEYDAIVQMFRHFRIPEHVSSMDLVCSIQRYAEATTDFIQWPGAEWANLMTIYCIKCLAILGFKASIEAIADNPTRVLFHIYLGFAFRIHSADRTGGQNDHLTAENGTRSEWATDVSGSTYFDLSDSSFLLSEDDGSEDWEHDGDHVQGIELLDDEECRHLLLSMFEL